MLYWFAFLSLYCLSFTSSILFITILLSAYTHTISSTQIWTSLNRPFYAAEGDSTFTREQTEQLLFRMPLIGDGLVVTRPHTASPENEVEPLTELDAETEQALHPTAPVMSFLHISDREVEKNVTLVVLN